MKSYKVVVTVDAQEDIKRYLRYIRNVKKNPLAAKNILDDYIATRMHLSTCAAMLADPDSEILKQRKLKRMNFLRYLPNTLCVIQSFPPLRIYTCNICFL